MDQQTTAVLGRSFTDLIIWLAPWAAGVLVVVLMIIYKDTIDDVVSGLMFMARKSIYRDANIIIFKQESRVVKVGLFTTVLFIYDNLEKYPGGRYEEISNSKIRKERYQILAPQNEFMERRKRRDLERRVRNIERKSEMTDNGK